ADRGGDDRPGGRARPHDRKARGGRGVRGARGARCAPARGRRGPPATADAPAAGRVVTGATDLAAGDPPAMRRDPGPTPWAAAARRRRLRVLAVTAVLVVATGAGYLLLLGTGPVRLSPGEVLAVLTGGGDARAIGVVWDLRLPVAVATVAVGAALGLAGAWTQTLARNPIASPDLLGVSGGAAVAVVAGTVVARPGFAVEISPYWWRALLAVAGAAAVVAVLALLGGFSAPRRLVVIGVALGLMCQGLLGYLMVRADLSRA